ncbi:transglutaminase-like protein [Sphingobium sp. SYK-6]|uniref:transglutaminase family protein n=1 Tax=Sphingobium sp. (strain NBRC 103272 / SYK-6) TaxID=627192 RepID=UPI000227761F|nr:transglutaminase family protein [Sphingobium sp. SYK-6]BAK67229.1 transglutaminase-like protein [Sphingobium sp. SYK-6]
MRISIRHETRYDYAEPAAGVVMRLCLAPASSNAQVVERWAVSVNGEPVERWISNGHGDAEAVWRAPGRVESVVILAEGTVRTSDTAGVLKPSGGELRPRLFLRPTPLTAADEAIAAFAERARSPDGPLASLHALCQLVHEDIAWRADSTTVDTVAAEAFAQRAGVCQDQSHIFIAAARSLGIPARYVVGYLRDPERPDGEHDPHAWAEAFVEGLGWIGFDPALGHCPVEGHVRLCCGLDAADAAPIRGVMLPVAETKLSHDVLIASLPPDDAAQAQTQQ